MAVVFDGNHQAAEKEKLLKKKVDQLIARGVKPKIAAILYQEDQASQTYTQLKSEAARRVGIEYQSFEFSMKDPIDRILDKVKQLNQDQSVTGIIIQKPPRKIWEKNSGKLLDKNLSDPEFKKQNKGWRQAFSAWWQLQTNSIDLQKDIDGLHPQTLAAIQNRSWREKGLVLPATCRAVLEILNLVAANPGKVLILGKSDLLGQPLYYVLKNRGVEVELLGSNEFQGRQQSSKHLLDGDIVVSATGQAQLITGKMVKDGVVMIDVGEPSPDIEYSSVEPKASFITPVPGGVGPMTVVCLLENAVDLLSRD